MNRSLCMLLLAAAVALVPNAVAQLTVVDNLGETPLPDIGGGIGASSWYAQGFVTPSDTPFFLSSVSVKLFRDLSAPGSGTFAVSLWDATGSDPMAGVPGTPVGTVTSGLSVSSVNEAPQDFTFGAPAGLTLAPDTSYFVVVSATSSVIDSGLYWSFTDSTSHTGTGRLGEWTWSVDQGAHWDFLSNDSPLQMAVTATPVPEPEVYASMFAVALLAFAAARRWLRQLRSGEALHNQCVVKACRFD